MTRSKIAVGLTGLVAVPAFAAVPENVSTALATGLTDAGTVAAAALIIVVAIAVFKYMRRAI